ncbi:MAG: YjjW family glycine radical enzyme activase [Nocardioidaceae bacterium]|nr:YjjW family glycine radical enzyme activase [Nocardioidaceae bacterium]
MTPTATGPGGDATGLVTDTIEFSPVDGPGNRFVVFLQGCSFDCVACHNPYTIQACIDCGACVPACPSGALTVDLGRMHWDEDLCTGGDACVAACPHDSTPKARTRTVADLLGRIRLAAPFLSGVTVSGGEATQQPGFVAELFTAIRQDPALAGLTCFIDSNGDCSPQVWERLLPVTDGVMVDLKCLDPDIHRRMTGQPNDAVRASIRLLAAAGRLHEVRLLMLPGINDADDLVAATGRWLAEVDPRMRVKVIGFRHHGVRPSPLPLVEPTDAQRRHYAEVLSAYGAFDVTVV